MSIIPPQFLTIGGNLYGCLLCSCLKEGKKITVYLKNIVVFVRCCCCCCNGNKVAVLSNGSFNENWRAQYKLF